MLVKEMLIILKWVRLMKKPLNINIFYLCVHKRIFEKVGLSGTMLKEDFYIMLGEIYHIPKVIRIIVLKEMEKLRMVEIVDKDFIKVNPLIIDPEENISKFYEKIGLFK